MDDYAFEWGDSCRKLSVGPGRRFGKTAASPVKHWHLEQQHGIKRVFSS